MQSTPCGKILYVNMINQYRRRMNRAGPLVSVLEEFRISASDTVHCTVQYLSNSTITYDTNTV